MQREVVRKPFVDVTILIRNTGKLTCKYVHLCFHMKLMLHTHKGCLYTFGTSFNTLDKKQCNVCTTSAYACCAKLLLDFLDVASTGYTVMHAWDVCMPVQAIDDAIGMLWQISARRDFNLSSTLGCNF